MRERHKGKTEAKEKLLGERPMEARSLEEVFRW